MNTPSASALRVLVVDDDDTFRQLVTSELARRGHSVEGAATGAQAVQLALRQEHEVVLLDLRLPDMDGLEVLSRLREHDVAAGVVMLTGHGTIDTAIQAIRLGASDFLEKPCPVDQMEMRLQKVGEHVRLLARQKVLQDGYTPSEVGPQFVGESPAFRKLLHDVRRVAETESTTLILGETGVGKEMVAMLLHQESPRREAPFVVVDCAALHEELLQSELFGHEKGAFSGAARQKHGLFEVAHGGTLFLDEVGDTSPDIQAKLLRVLESGRFRRLGGTREIEVDVRIVSATNRDLPRAIEEGRFREDLYFRLSTLTVHAPPLRERREDIPLLVRHFTEHFNRRTGRAAGFGPAALEALCAYSWPGNVRELKHVVEQAVVLSEGRPIEPADLSIAQRAPVRAPGRQPAAGEELGLTLAEVEERHVKRVLESVDGNRGKAARVLGISERNLYRLLKRYDEAAGIRGPASGRG